MISRSLPLVIAMLISIVHFPASAAESGSDLVIIQQKFLASVKPQYESYYQELSTLEKTLQNQGDTEKIDEVRSEIIRVESQLKVINDYINYKPEAVTAVPEQKTAPKPETEIKAEPKPPYKPQTQVLEIEGIAGTPKFSKNNVYTFNLLQTGEKSHLKFYATGRRSTDTKGDVWLIKPGGEKIKISKWRESDFKYSSKEIQTYKTLDPITADLSGEVGGPGKYQVEFEWTGGIDPLVIYRVELTS